MIKLSVTCSKKDRNGTFASVGVSDFEVEQSVVDDAPALQAAVRYLQAAATQAVDAYLKSQAVASHDPSGARSAERAYAAAEQKAYAQAEGLPLPPAAPTQPRPATPSAPSPPPVASAPPASTPPPVAPAANGKTYYGSARAKDGPPTSAKQLGGWAKKTNALPWFEDFGRKQDPPLPRLLSEWSDDWAVFAYQQYLAACIPPVANGAYGTHYAPGELAELRRSQPQD
jgi:hypothetical protein